MFNLLWNKPKPERFSLENLKALCQKLQHFPGDANEENIISCLKELTQLLIWGDQHDPSLLDHFFEENIQATFLEILESKNDGSLIVQVLQTLNIMFENVRSRESLYFLLSNNYVNKIISLKYDFSNDEILAYYIYLLRTLSFKLSKDTIYFFFNEHLDDFPLYSEAIKFFNHEESMIRIAVRVITLNVYSVNDQQMQDFILDRTTTTYFSNLVWFIGNYGTTINDMLLHSGEGESSRINYYLAEHMDCFYYVNDIIELDVPKINKILISHLLNRLLRPMYLDSLLPAGTYVPNASKSSSSSKLMPLVALSLMLHAFHVLKYPPLVSALTSTLFSNQHYLSSHLQHSHSYAPSHRRQSPSPLMMGAQAVSPETSRPASPVTSKFHSFGLLGPGLASPGSPDPPHSPHSGLFSNTFSPARFDLLRPLSPQSASAQLPSFASISYQQQEEKRQDQQQPQCRQQNQERNERNAKSQYSSQNPYKATLYGYLSQVQDDQLVLPAMTLLYLVGRNPGVISDALLGTDIYPQRLLKSRMLMGNLMSSSTSPKNFVQGTTGTAMSRGRSGDSILSNNDTKGADSLPGTWSSPSLGAGGGSTGVGIGSNSSSLFGVTGAVAQIARMRTKIDSPLFETEEKDKESQEAEELLASDTELAPPPLPISSASPVSYSRTEDGSKSLSSSMPSSAGTSVATLVNRRPSLTTSQNHSSDQYGFNKGDLGPKPATFEGIKKGNNNSKISSLLAPIMPSSAGHTVVSVSEQSEGGASDEHEMGQELRPIHTPKCNREATEIYPSADEESDNEDKLKNDRTVLPPSIPPPLPPRHVSQGPLQCQPQQHDEIAPDQESVSMRVEPIIQNREDLINRLMNIICGQPESGAHRFRIITIHMAAELLMEFVFTKGVSNNTATNASTIKEENNQAQNAAASQQSAESHLGEVDMQRLASAEAQFRVRVQKGIRRLERKKQRASLKQGGDGAGTASLFPQPLGILTGRIERAMTESKLGIDKQIVNIIAESSVIYGPDKDLDNEPDIDPTPELATLFSLDPEYTNIRHEKTDTRGRTWKNEEYINGQHQNQPPVSSSSNGPISFKERFRSRSRTRSKISSMIRGSSEPRPPQSDRQDAPLQPPQSRLSGTQRLEAMVVRYIKWLHILIQCRQVLSRKAVTPAGPSASPNPATFGVTTNHGLMARALIAGAPLQPTVDTTSVEANSVNLLADKGSPSISITKSFEDSRNSTPLLASIPALNMAPTLPAQIERRSSDLLSGGGHTTPTSSSGNVVSAHKGLQKALATTATTTTTAQGNGTPLTTLESPTLAPKETGGVTGLTPSPLAEPVNADFTWPSSAPSSKSSFTSLSLTSTVPYETADSGSEQGGKPTTTALQSESIKASGRGIGAKSALTATAALEAAAAANSNNANGFGHSINANNHPFINDMLTNHLDPLSASVSEVIRKSSARFKSVVDPLSSNQLFKPSPSPSVASSTLGPEKEPLPPVNKGFYRPTAPIAGPPTELSAATSSASSVVSMNSKPASSYVPTRQRSPSGGSTNSWTSHSAGTAVSTAGTSVLGAVSSSVIRRVSEDYSTLNELTSPGSVKIVRDGNENEDGSGFMSILDPGHPAQQSDPQVAKILETLGLTATNINLSA